MLREPLCRENTNMEISAQLWAGHAGESSGHTQGIRAQEGDQDRNARQQAVMGLHGLRRDLHSHMYHMGMFEHECGKEDV